MKNNHINSYMEMIRHDFEEWKRDGVCSRAEAINQQLRSEYFDVASPHYFTGDFESEIVLIHLNPKRKLSEFRKPCDYTSFEEYRNFYQTFGTVHYGPKSGRTHKSPFDHKQIRFLKPLGVIPFVVNDDYENLRLAIDNKLQLELVPYGSPDFNHVRIGQNNVKQFVDDIIKVIGSAPRKFVVFCGKVFPDLLEPFAHTLKKHKFRLLKNDETQTKSHFEIINIDLQCEGMEPIRACIAPQFPKQGYPVGRYGEKLAELYFDIK